VLRSLRRFASPVVPGTRYALTVELISDLAYTLAAGHQLGLIITSSNFPRFAQNPNNGDPFIGGSPPVFVTNTLYLDGMSAIVLAVGP
jgi:predicted acyl esterase